MKVSNLFIVNLLREIAQLPVWWFSSVRKRDPKTWVFGAWFGNSYSDNAKVMFEYVLSNHSDINAFWITSNSDVFHKLESEKKPVVMKGTKQSKKVCAKAGFVFITQTAYEMESLYINGAKQVWLWHGMPLKKIGSDLTHNLSAKEKIHKFFPQNNINKPDWFISLSHEWDPVLKKVYPTKNVVVTGLPRNDLFFSKNTTPLIEQINQKFNNPLKVLYMPTFRDKQYSNKVSFNPFSMFGFSIDRFNSYLNESNTIFLYKGHYCDLLYQKGDTKQEKRLIVLNESMYSDLYSLIKDADILMTDYSSVYFDFLLLNKPIILTPFDKEEYLATSREMYFDYEKEIEGIRANDWNDVISILKEKKYYVPSKKTIDKFNEHQDGNSTKRVTDLIYSMI